MRVRASRALVHLRAQWAGFLALFLVLTGGVAYAADTIGSSDVINDSLLSEDLKNNDIQSVDIRSNGVTSEDVANQQVYSADVRDDTLGNGGLQAVDLRAGSVRSSEVAADSLQGGDINEATLDIGEPTTSTVFRTDSVVDQPSGQFRTMVQATGLQPGDYLISFRMYMTNPQRYECGVLADGSF